MITLETERLILRPYTASDLDALHTIVSDNATMSFWPQPFTREQTEQWLRRHIASCEQHGYGRCGIGLKAENGRLIGDCGIMLSEVDGTPEYDLGYIIYAPWWGRGYGFEAAEAWLAYGIDRLGLSRICANMPHDHSASERVALKLGMRFERRFRNSRNRDIETKLYCYQKV